MNKPTDDELRSWYYALAHLADHGEPGVAPIPVLRALQRKGGNAAKLATRLLAKSGDTPDWTKPEEARHEWWNQ